MLTSASVGLNNINPSAKGGIIDEKRKETRLTF